MNTRNTTDVRWSIVFVTSVYPHAQAYGAQQRVLNMLRALRQLGDVSIVLLVDPPVDAERLRKTRDEFGEVTVFEVRETPLTTLGQRLRFEFDPRQTNTSFYGIGETDRDRLVGMLATHDLAWIHTLRTANECGIHKWPRSVLDLDDIPSQLNATNSRVQSGILRRLKAQRMALIWRRREQRVFERFDMVTVCSEPDRRYLGGGQRVTVVPNGFEEPPSRPARVPAQPPRVGFVGALWGRPNREGIGWFIKDVWPLVKSKSPHARLRLVGEDAGFNLSDDGPDIDQLGYLVDPNDEIGTWSAMVVPIRIGGGTRVKIAQAFSRNCPVVSTTIGAYGYSMKDGEEIAIADDIQAFAQACVRFIDDPAFGSAVAEKAWAKFQSSWTWRAVGDSLTQALVHFFTETERSGARGTG